MLNMLYDIFDLILPFEWLKYEFMKNAFIAIILVALLFGILGTMVVSNKMAFFADALGHGAFTGIAIGIVIGGVEPIIGATVFSIIFAIAITIIKNRGTSSTDTIIGVFSSTAVALGLVLMSLNGNLNKFSSYLVGDILSITKNEIIVLVLVFCIVILVWSVLFNKLLLVSTNSSLANSRGTNTLIIEIIFTCIIAVVVTLTVRWVGLLIINSLLVLPAAAARNISKNIRMYNINSILISLFSGVGGLIISYYFNTVTGATIVLIASIIFFISLVFKNKFS